MRNLVRETRLEPSQFILPLFACPGKGVRREIGNGRIFLSHWPVKAASVQSVDAAGVILTTDQYELEEASGKVSNIGVGVFSSKARIDNTPLLPPIISTP